MPTCTTGTGHSLRHMHLRSLIWQGHLRWHWEYRLMARLGTYPDLQHEPDDLLHSPRSPPQCPQAKTDARERQDYHISSASLVAQVIPQRSLLSIIPPWRIALTCKTHKAQKARHHRFQLPRSAATPADHLTVPGVRIAYCNDDDVILDEEKHQPREQDTRATCENVECEVRGRRGVREERKDAQGEVE